MEIFIPQNVQMMLDKLNSNGHEAYIVGGCVRDALLGKTPHDYDICTSARPSEVAECFSSYNCIKTGVEHGTITVVVEKQAYEVTTFRTEGRYSDSRRPDNVEFIKDLRTDLSRRDFTINAMAYTSSSGIVDFYGGKEDLKRKKIRAVGDAEERFAQDALRILRALRFASVLGFTLDMHTSNAAHALCKNLNNIAKERINKELSKLLMGGAVKAVMQNYADVFCEIIPQIEPMIGFSQNNVYHKYDVYEHTVNAISCAENNLSVRLAALLHDTGKPFCHTRDSDGVDHFYKHEKYSEEIARQALTQLKFDKKTICDVAELVLYHGVLINPTKKAIKRWLNKIGYEQMINLLHVKNADICAQSSFNFDERIVTNSEILKIIIEIKEEVQCYKVSDLKISGNDIIELGVKQGREVGVILQKLLDMVIDETLENDRAVLIKYVKSISP